MPFIQKRPQVSDNIQLYTLGLHKTLLIAGLGNPGKDYDGTRHNIGFVCLDKFAASNDFPAWIIKKDLRCQFTQTTLNQVRVILIKPTTFMNDSGQAVQAAAGFYKIPPDRIAVVHDELDIPFGQIRTRVGGSAAGHNGIKSIIEQCGEDFGRVRIGIGPKRPASADSADFVLKKFAKTQQALLPALVLETAAILSEYAYSGGQLPADTRNFLI